VKIGNSNTVSEAGAASSVNKEKDRPEDDDGTPVYDSNNLEGCKAFLDAKKKLRLILSHVDIQVSSVFHTSLTALSFS
jgi:hypothetical protein